MSDKVEELKQIVIKFNQEQQKLIKLMFSLTPEEHAEFHPWHMTYLPPEIKE